MTDEIKKDDIVTDAPQGVEEAQDAPKKGAAKAEPMAKAGDYEDLGPAVVKPTDKNPDAVDFPVPIPPVSPIIIITHNAKSPF